MDKKKIAELQNGEIIYQYGIGTFPDREFIFMRELRIDNTESNLKLRHRDFTAAVDVKHPALRYVLKGNEAVVFRNALWLCERDDEKAERILLEYLNRKINMAQHTIDLYEARIAQVETFFEDSKGKF